MITKSIERLFTVKEISTMLGISVSYVRSLKKLGFLMCVKDKPLLATLDQITTGFEKLKDPEVRKKIRDAHTKPNFKSFEPSRRGRPLGIEKLQVLPSIDGHGFTIWTPRPVAGKLDVKALTLGRKHYSQIDTRKVSNSGGLYV